MAMEDPPYAPRPSGFQYRASRFFQKVSTFGRHNKLKPSQHASPYPRSMSMGSKPYMSQPALAIQSVDHIDNDGSSPSDDDIPPRSTVRFVNNPTPRLPPKHSHHSPSLSAGIVVGTHAASTIIARPARVEGLPVFSGPSPHATLPRHPQRVSEEAFDDVIVIGREHSTAPASKSFPLPLGAAMPLPPRGSIADRPHIPRHAPPRIAPSASLPAPTPRPPRLPSLRISDLPSSLNRLSVDGSLRLTPSFVTHHPLPILNLPTLPPPSPSVTSERLRLRASLRAMPALPLEGSDDPETEADGSGLGDSDDEDDEETETEGMTTGTGSEDDEDLSESGSRNSDRVNTTPKLPSLDTSRIVPSFMDYFSHVPISLGARGQEGDATPTTSLSRRDYFCAKPNSNGSLSHSPARTPHPDNSSYSPIRTPHPDDRYHSRLIIGQSNFTPIPATPVGSHPGLYQHASRSMVDILTISKRESMAAAIESEVERRKSIVQGKARAREPSNPSEPVAEEPSARQKRISEAPAYESLSNALRRRRSMPTFNPATLPPPYPSFGPHPMRQNFDIQPRDDEGRERLPPYTNSIYLSAIMPRKLEFSSPGVQAKDRKWHRVFCVLEGTTFRVYKCSRALGVGILGQWWEKKVGVGDIAVLPNSGTRAAGPKKPAERPAKLELNAEELSVEQGSSSDVPSSPTTRIPKRLGSRLLPGASAARPHDLPGPNHSPRPSLSIPRPSHSGSSSTSLSINVPSSASSQVSSTASSSRSHFRSSSSQVSMDVPLVEPPMSDIIRKYTLQHAESGLGNDYIKRQHVIRVRLEGEQFLLQATDVGAVVDWIEGFQAATNIALDLDERPMPKGPGFPRRRRRRPPATTS